MSVRSTLGTATARLVNQSTSAKGLSIDVNVDTSKGMCRDIFVMKGSKLLSRLPPFLGLFPNFCILLVNYFSS